MTDLLDETGAETKVFRRMRARGLADINFDVADFAQEIALEILDVRVSIHERALEATWRKFTDETGVEVSSGTKRLIMTILNAVLSDPHPLWKATPAERVEIVGSYISSLPSLLSNVVTDEGVEGKITSFDLLHWISKDRDLAKLCLITK
jgi:hypothetical protein